MRQEFLVAIPTEDGGLELHPMKAWLRQHPDQLPPGLDATSSTSHQLRNALRARGWSVQESETQVRMVPQGSLLLPQIEITDEPEEPLARPEAAFALEYQLRDFLAQNLSIVQVDGHTLHLYVDPSGRDGIEFPTAVGPIDILARDDAGAFIVFELKRARSPDHAIGQLARYMGWVKQTIGRDQSVRGVIVARTITDNLRYAISVVPDVSLFEYEVSFHLRPAGAFADVLSNSDEGAAS